jgi:hypothetical protein
MATYNNYSISFGKGKLYLKEKQPTEGFVEVIYGVNNDQKTYHRYVDSIVGVPSRFEVKEITYQGRTLKFLELSLKDGDTYNKVSVPLKNTKGLYSDEAKALLSALNGLDLGEEVTLTVNVKESEGKNGKTYKNLNIYINYVHRLGDNGKGQSTGFISFNDIPRPTEKIVAGDKTYDYTAQTEFFYAKLQEIQAKFGGAETKTTTQTPKQEPLSTAPFQTIEPKNLSTSEPDDLPF